MIVALMALFCALLAAPLALGSYVVVQRAGERALTLWFGAISGLLLLALLAGILGLLVSSLT